MKACRTIVLRVGICTLVLSGLTPLFSVSQSSAQEIRSDIRTANKINVKAARSGIVRTILMRSSIKNAFIRESTSENVSSFDVKLVRDADSNLCILDLMCKTIIVARRRGYKRWNSLKALLPPTYSFHHAEMPSNIGPILIMKFFGKTTSYINISRFSIDLFNDID